MTLGEKQRRFTLLTARLIEWAYDNGFELTYGHAWRDSETQARLVAQRLSKTLASKHCDRLAVDFNASKGGALCTPEQYRPLGEKWESLGGRWGGRFGVKPENYARDIGWDSGHFEYDGGEVMEHPVSEYGTE